MEARYIGCCFAHTQHSVYVHAHLVHPPCIPCAVCVHLLDISRQLACMKLGRREKYQPIQYCWAGCLGYPVHTCHLPIDIQQIYCSAQTGQHSRLRSSCCPVWALQHICTVHTCTCTWAGCATVGYCVHTHTVYMYMYATLYMCILHVHVHVNSFNETGQSKQLRLKTTPFFSRERKSCLRQDSNLHTCMYIVYVLYMLLLVSP